MAVFGKLNGATDLECRLQSGNTHAFDFQAPLTIWLIPIALWGFLRLVLFEGLQGADDLEHLRFAWALDRIPANHWELRLPYNLLLAGCLRLFGFNEFTAALPALFGSFLLMVFSGLTVRSVTGNARAGVIAMLVVCLLPGDVLGATQVGGSRELGTGLLAFSIWCLLTRNDWRWVLSGGLSLGVVVDCHLSLLFFVVVFFGVFGALVPQYRSRILAMWLLGAGVFVLLDPLPWWLLTGDPLYRLHVIEQTHLGSLATDVNQRVLFDADGHLNLSMILQPLQDFVISKPFAVLPVLMLMTGALAYHRLGREVRGVFVAGCVYWLYMSYGTHSPTGYEPFPGTVSYWQPLAIPLTIVIGASLPLVAVPRIRYGLALGTAGLCLVLMSLSGKWGQNVEIAKQFLAWTRAHPDAICVTDDRTAREMRTLNGFVTPENLRLVPGSLRSEIWQVPCLRPEDYTESEVYVMYNILNDPSQAVSGHHIPDNAGSVEWLNSHSGDSVHQTSPAWRPAAYLLPQTLRPEFLTRRPVSDIRLYSHAATDEAVTGLQDSDLH